PGLHRHRRLGDRVQAEPSVARPFAARPQGGHRPRRRSHVPGRDVRPRPAVHAPTQVELPRRCGRRCPRPGGRTGWAPRPLRTGPLTRPPPIPMEPIPINPERNQIMNTTIISTTPESVPGPARRWLQMAGALALLSATLVGLLPAGAAHA